MSARRRGPRAAGCRARSVRERACTALLPEVEVVGGARWAGRVPRHRWSGADESCHAAMQS
eukprot:4667755-Lingulodinium_polyedra.AAC.1